MVGTAVDSLESRRIEAGILSNGNDMTREENPFQAGLGKFVHLDKVDFIGKLRDELLNGEIFYTLKEAQSLVQGWRREYNQVRPHSSLGYRPPAPEATLLQPAALRFAGSNNLLSAPIL